MGKEGIYIADREEEKPAAYEFSQYVPYFLSGTVLQEAQLGDDPRPKADGL